MKILMICTVSLGANGISTCVVNYSCGLRAAGQDVHILAPEGVSADLCRKLADNQVPLHQLPHRKAGTLLYFRRLFAHLRAHHYDVVHIHGNSCTTAIELTAAFLAGVPVRIAHSHSSSCEYMRAHKLLRPIFELCVNGRFACGQNAGLWLFRKKSFTVIRNGIDLDAYRPNKEQAAKQRQALGIPADALVLGHVGMFAEVKNHIFFVKLAQQLLQLPRNWVFLLVGDGELQPQIRQAFADAGLSERVIFTGNVPSAAPYLQAMDLFVMPSLYEGLPFVLVEAQASGLHALVSDRVSTEADMTGNLQFLPIDSTTPWETAIAQLALPDRFTTSEQACVKLEAAGYSMQANVQHLVECYTRLTKKKGR